MRLTSLRAGEGHQVERVRRHRSDREFGGSGKGRPLARPGRAIGAGATEFPLFHRQDHAQGTDVRAAGSVRVVPAPSATGAAACGHA
jgi:hypothetical protein